MFTHCDLDKPIHSNPCQCYHSQWHCVNTQLFLFIDDYTTRLTSQAILAMKSGNKGRALQLLKRRCVADGIKHMYRQYRQTKLAQAKTLALSVAGTLGHPAPLPIRPTDNHTGVEEIQVEKFAQTMMVAQCNFTRNG